jgi:helix-turn-helix protein
MKDLITMSNQELHRVEIVQKLIDKRLTESEAAKQCHLSVRQIRRLKKLYLAHGAQGLISKKRGKPSNHRYPDSVKTLALAYVHEYYRDFRPTFACEKLSENHDLHVSHETLRQWMIEAELWQSKAQRLKRSFQPRNRRECFGELIQIDGSPHDWFESRGPKCTLLVYIDDATGQLMECQFVTSESTFTYFDSTRRYLEKHGKPVAFYSDKHSVFRTNKTGEFGGDGITQFGRALADLNIDIICANTPQAKGRVERVNQTLQDRLVKEMRLWNIADAEQGNRYLPGFMAKFNAQFGKEPINSKNLHRQLLPQEDLNEIFSWQEERTLSKNLTLQYDKTLYLIEDSIDNRCLARNKVTVFDYFDGSIKIKWQHRELPYRIFDKMQKVDQGEIVSNKRLGAALNYIKEKQDLNDESRSASVPSRQHLGKSSTTKIRNTAKARSAK